MKGPADRHVARRLLESVYRGPAWHGPAVRASIRGVPSAVAARRIAPRRPTIQEIVVHLAYGRHVLIDRLAGERGERFERRLRKQWWPETAPGPKGWNEDRALLEREHARLLEAIAATPERRLRASRHAHGLTLADELLGLAVHDGYHAGQIALLRRALR
ncbi:MAG: DinB family protein [Gemmatimonadales bacterium]